MLDLLPRPLRRLLLETPELSEAYLVGGCVRDWIIGRPCGDFDIEVYGLGYDELVRVLARHGRADLVGSSFGVVKFNAGDGHFHDFSLPRRDSKVGRGHRGFAVELDRTLGPEEASSRRDFTVNSLMFHVRTGRLLDFHGGERDLRAGVLRHTGPAFVEDPLRVLRGMQFCSRLRLSAAPETLALCRSMAGLHGELPVERIRDEWTKWATREGCPSLGLGFLADSGWLVHYPELAAMVGVPQDPEWHPEGDVWTHTGHCLDALFDAPAWTDADPATRSVLAFALLLHDAGKASCTRRETRDGVERVVSPGHDREGGPLAAAFLERLAIPEAQRVRVVPLVTQHMAHLEDPTARAIRRLANRLHPATIRELVSVIAADSSGRPPLPRRVPESALRLLEKAEAMSLEAAAPKPLLQGRHLIARGLRPGPEFGECLRAAFEAQLDGAFSDASGAESWLDRRLGK
ncbi:MAG: polynucleotide adenylyltransferase [Verrucomicrobia bacterium]|nr:MAG: polynucleotide adenylyltransferase [Verrucomicrobiota bacterium]